MVKVALFAVHQLSKFCDEIDCKSRLVMSTERTSQKFTVSAEASSPAELARLSGKKGQDCKIPALPVKLVCTFSLPGVTFFGPFLGRIM